VKEMMLTKGKLLGFNESAFTKFFSFIDGDYSPSSLDNFKPIQTLFLSEMIAEINGSYYVMSIVKVNNADRAKVAAALNGEKNVIILDTNEMTSKLVRDIKNDFALLVKLCLVFVTITLIIAMGRFETGLIAAIPMLVSWLWTLGFMGITGIKFNIFNIIVSTFVFGLGVDYSILMMQGLLLEYKYGQKDLSAYKTSIFLSSFTTIVGVGVLMLTRHPALNWKTQVY
jgi:predicted RND superfamily exporter protein